MRRHQGLYLASIAGWLSSALGKFKNAYWSAVRTSRHLVPYSYENSILHFLPYFFGSILFAVLVYAFGTLALAFVLLLLPPEMLAEILSGMAELPLLIAEPLFVEPFYAVLIFLGSYLVFVLTNHDWWSGWYDSPGTERWRLLAVYTLVGGGAAVYVVLSNRDVLPVTEPLVELGYVFFAVGVVGFAHYFGATLLDDAANHGASLDPLWRAVVYFEAQALAVVSAYSVFFGLPFSSAVGDAFVVAPFVFGVLYVGYRYATLGSPDADAGFSFDEETDRLTETDEPTAEETGEETDDIDRREEAEETDSTDRREDINEIDQQEDTEETGDTDRQEDMDPTENLEKIHELIDSTDLAEKRRGLEALYVVARREPESASRFVPVLVGLLDSERNQIRGESAEIIWEIAKEEPRKAAEAADGLGDLLREDYPPAQRVALGALAEIAEERPHDISHLTDDIVLLTESPNRRIQTKAFRVLKNIGMDGEGIRERKSDLVSGYGDSDTINEDAKRRERQTGDGDPESKFIEEPPDVTFDDVGGMNDLLDELHRRVVRPLRDPEVYEEHGASVVNGILFHGPPGTGKTYIAEALGGELGYSFVQVHSSDVLSKYIGESANQIEEMFDAAVDNQPCVIFFDEIDAIAADRTGDAEQHQSQRQMVSELLRQLTRIQGERVVVMGATNILEEVDDAIQRRNRFDMLFEVPLPDAGAREEIFRVHLRESPHDEESIDWDVLVEATEGYAAGDIETIVNHAAMKAAEEAQHADGGEVVPISQSHLEAGIEDVEPSSKDLSGAADHLREPPEVDFDDVGGMEGLKQELRELIIEPLENPEMYEEYGLTTANGVLAHGPPGTGKTYTAEALAGELGYRFIFVKPDDIVSKWAGEAPNKISGVFDVAVQNQPCLVLMDELDAIASERGSASETRTERQTVNQLLTELERIEDEDVIVLATTNAYEDLDAAVVRTGRFDRKIEFPPPDAEARVEILKIHLREPPLADDIDWDELARETDGLVASDLTAVAESAARKAIEESRGSDGFVPVGQKHIEEAVEEVEPTLLKWNGNV